MRITTLRCKKQGDINMSIHLTKEGSLKTTDEKTIMANHIVVRDDWCGKKLNAEEFQGFQKIVNVRRPYRREDFVTQTFIPDLSHIR